MDPALPAPILVPEKRLAGTLITRKPSKSALFAATITVLVMTLVTLFYWTDPWGWAADLPAVREKIFTRHQYWRAFTAIFIHADLEHLLSNMYMLWIFSFFVFGYFGFSVFPVLSFFLATLVNGLAVLSYAPDLELLGASGLVYVLGGFWLALYFMIQRQHRWPARLIRVTGIAFMIFWPTTFAPSTSYRTHALGFAAGIIAGIFYYYRHRRAIRAYDRYQLTLVESEPEVKAEQS